MGDDLAHSNLSFLRCHLGGLPIADCRLEIADPLESVPPGGSRPFDCC